jgi:predicted Fe-Mo cluster-binding NifX family protein
MKVIVTSQGTELSSQVDARFGRAKYFLLYDTEDKSVLVINNEQNMNTAQGAGTQAAQTVAASGAAVLITGNIGPKAMQALQLADIETYLFNDGTVENAIKKFQDGQLSKTDKANVESHW